MEKLWAVHITGPDDVCAAPSFDDATRVAAGINAEAPQESCIEASVIEWPYDQLSHARSLQDWEQVGA